MMLCWNGGVAFGSFLRDEWRPSSSVISVTTLWIRINVKLIFGYSIRFQSLVFEDRKECVEQLFDSFLSPSKLANNLIACV